MKKSLILSTAMLVASAQFAAAGGMAEPVMTPKQVEQSTSSSAGGVIAPLPEPTTKKSVSWFHCMGIFRRRA